MLQIEVHVIHARAPTKINRQGKETALLYKEVCCTKEAWNGVLLEQECIVACFGVHKVSRTRRQVRSPKENLHRDC